MDEEPQESRVAVNGVELAVYEWPGEGPPALLAHANSFHGRCWDPVVAALPGRRRIALDLRGHGRSAKPAPPYSWPDFGADLAALAGALGLRGAVGVGHSLGGYATALAAALAPGAFAALLLIDPVILPPAYYTGAPLPGAHGAARRRSHWPSPEAFYERLHAREPFSRWEPAALRAYCRHGLLSLVGMVGPSIDFQLFQKLASKTILGQHSPHGKADHPFGILEVHLARRGGLDSPHITAVSVIDLLIPFVARQLDFFGVDDHYKTAHVHVRREVRQMFPSQLYGNPAGQSAKNLVFGVHQNPVALVRFKFCAARFH